MRSLLLHRVEKAVETIVSLRLLALDNVVGSEGSIKGEVTLWRGVVSIRD